MIRVALVLALLSLAACSSTEPEGSGLDALTEQFVRARAEVPSFGGVAIEGDRPVVITLGADPAAGPAVRSIFGDAAEVRARPEQGRGSEALKDRVSNATFGVVEDAQSVDYDETTGYVVLELVTAAALGEVYPTLERAGVPTSEVLVEVSGSRIVFL